jgi:hypothetical protein
MKLSALEICILVMNAGLVVVYIILVAVRDQPSSFIKPVALGGPTTTHSALCASNKCERSASLLETVISLFDSDIDPVIERLNLYRDTYADPDRYIFIVEDSASGDPSARTMLYHYQSAWEDKTVQEASDLLEAEHEGLDLKEIIDTFYIGTRAGDGYYSFKYRWFETIGNQEVVKHSIVYRSGAYVIGCGFVDSIASSAPKKSLQIPMVALTAFVAVVLFIWPAPLIQRSLLSYRNSWSALIPATIPLAVLLTTHYYVAVEITQPNLPFEQMKEASNTAREFGIGLSLLALAITLVAGLLQEDKMNIIFATLLSFFFSMIATLKVWKAATRDDMYQLSVTRETLNTYSISTLVWIFSLILVKYWHPKNDPKHVGGSHASAIDLVR